MKRQSSVAAAAEQEERIISSLSSKFVEFENTDLLGPIIDSLRENIKPGICLICIEDVERKEPIWNCKNCYCILHLVCIQRWAKDSISNVKEAAAEKGFNLPIVWCCPKCRGENSEENYPTAYYCFCGKVANPPDDPWNAPHSCGEPCSKQLKNCKHNCSLLCHLGSCPLCPKQLSSTCFCGRSDPRTLRCYLSNWSCEGICSKDLPCGFHKCKEKCHPSDCPKCDIPITLTCKCAKPKEIQIGCAELTEKTVPVSCGETCGKLLHCGVHACKQKCHEGPCAPCVQSCPCGKQKVECSGSNGKMGFEKSCGETCEKLLDCNLHICQQKCHSGDCGMCLDLRKKRCKCGTYENEVQCSKDFVCTTRCGKLKNCKLHTCNKKCCPGDCAFSCTKLCDKTLKCKNHKCTSLCGHRGPCFPCPVSAPVKCRCGETVIYVPCGSEKRAKHPTCSKSCGLKSKCDHPSIQPHKCHFGDCPRCILPCTKKLDCGHECVAKCHSFKTQRKPCPPCTKLVKSKCSLHSDTEVPCGEIDNPCKEMCGKQLACGVHTCMKRCHIRVQDGCGECRDACGRERSCEHSCSLGCHSGPCPDCNLVTKVPCHCGSELLFVNCSDKDNLTESGKSCKNQCSLNLSCKHRCLQICHSGECSESDRCRRKVKMICKCRKLKKDMDCYLVDREKKILDCIDPPCTISVLSKSDSPNRQSHPRKPRNRKKKTSESESAIPDPSEDDKAEIKSNSTAAWIKIATIAGVVALVSMLYYNNF